MKRDLVDADGGKVGLDPLPAPPAIERKVA
jgi:hypothetical protein